MNIQTKDVTKDRTAGVLTAMLTEPTAAALCDSGSIYGRNWQRNQGRDFEAEPASAYNLDWGGLSLVHSLYHWLNATLTYAPQVDRHFRRWRRREDSHNTRGHLANMGEYTAWLVSRSDVRVLDFGEVNTANGDSLLSQVIQYREFEIADSDYKCLPEGQYILLQIHGGCDLRGGYTEPRVFQVYPDDFPALADHAKAMLACPTCRAIWQTEDAGGHWDVAQEGQQPVIRKRGTPNLADVELYDEEQPNVALIVAQHRNGVSTSLAYVQLCMQATFGVPLVKLGNQAVLCPACGDGVLQADY